MCQFEDSADCTCMENELFQLLFIADTVKWLIVLMCFSDQKITLRIFFFLFSYTFYHQPLVIRLRSVYMNVLKFTWIHSDISNKSMDVIFNFLAVVLSETHYF